ITAFLRSILQPQNPKHNFGAGNKHHHAHVKTFLTYTACVKAVFRVLVHVESKDLCSIDNRVSVKKIKIVILNFKFDPALRDGVYCLRQSCVSGSEAVISNEGMRTQKKLFANNFKCSDPII
ncbi:hypothetical protein BpHYR1_051246, partial [Brachionus plicatilis]